MCPFAKEKENEKCAKNTQKSKSETNKQTNK